MRKFLRSKTLNFSGLLTILGVVEMNLHLIKDNISEYYGLILFLVAIATAWLRWVTSQSLKDKMADP